MPTITMRERDIHRDQSSERWGDTALQHLERWLIRHDVPDDEATFLVEGIWVFYSYDLLPLIQPETRRPLPIGIAAKTDDGRRRVQLVLPGPATPGVDLPDELSTKQLHRAFEKTIADKLPDGLSAQLGFAFDLGHLDDFARAMRDFCRDEGWDYLGLFTDHLEDELKTVIAPGQVDEWLDAPNSRLMGKAPRELLGTPQDIFIRDAIMDARHGLYG